MKKIIIGEASMARLLKEEINGWSDKVLLVKKYLDGKYGRPNGVDYVVEVDPRTKEAVRALTDVQLFDDLVDEFRDIIGDRWERDKFLKQVIKDWYRDKISKYGTLTAY